MEHAVRILLVRLLPKTPKSLLVLYVFSVDCVATLLFLYVVASTVHCSGSGPSGSTGIHYRLQRSPHKTVDRVYCIGIAVRAVPARRVVKLLNWRVVGWSGRGPRAWTVRCVLCRCVSRRALCRTLGGEIFSENYPNNGLHRHSRHSSRRNTLAHACLPSPVRASVSARIERLSFSCVCV